MLKYIMFLVSFTIFAPQVSAGSVEGNQRYTPTAIEWLTLYCNSLGTSKTGYYSSCISDDKNTITVNIGYWDKTLEKEANDEFIPISYLLNKYAKSKGWSWLNIKKNVQFITQ